MIHRDVKPANLLLNEKFQLVMADFGTARQIDTSDLLSESNWQLRRVASQHLLTMGKRLSDEEELVGSEDYVSPETLTGNRKVHHQGADLWSLGVIMWQLFSKARDTPFASKS
jgi:serine/threonine protein kinase